MASRTFTIQSRKVAPRLPSGTRIYAVGDIHGCAELLTEVLRRVDADLTTRPVAKPVQVFLGDYIDRGPHSREVLNLLIARRRAHQAVFLQGNHELYAAEALTDSSIVPEWMKFGGISTLTSYGVRYSGRGEDPAIRDEIASAFRGALPDTHYEFLNSLALSFSCGDFFFVHAGVRPGIPLQHQDSHDLLWIRNEFLLHEEDFGRIVVHGHSPVMEPEVRSNRINIDTGAYATGRLTCLVLEDDRIDFL